MVQASTLRISLHAVDRYREHHPEADEEDVRNAIRWGARISPWEVAPLCGKTLPDLETDYKVAPDKRGIFVLRGCVVTTYLRRMTPPEQYTEPSPPTECETQANPITPVSESPLPAKKRKQQEWWAEKEAEAERLWMKELELRYAPCLAAK